MTENAQAQDGGQNQQQQAQPQQQVQGTASQQPNADSIARAARLDGEGEGYSKAARELGVTIDEAKNIIQDHQKRVDAEKTAQQRLADREGELNTVKEEATSLKQRADRYEKIVKAAVGNQLELVGDDAIKELLSGMDVGSQFEWLQKHGARYVQAPQPEQAQAEEGQTDTEAFLQRLRGPDASQPTNNPGLADAAQQMNDLIRARGLGGS